MALMEAASGKGSQNQSVALTTLDAFEVTLTTDTNAYANGDLLADTQVISDVMTTNGGSRELRSLILTDESNQGKAIDILFLKSNTTLGTENLAPTNSAAQGKEIVGVVNIVASDYTTIGGCRKAEPAVLPQITLTAPDNSTDIYIAAIMRDASGGTYSASALTVRIGLL